MWEGELRGKNIGHSPFWSGRHGRWWTIAFINLETPDKNLTLASSWGLKPFIKFANVLYSAKLQMKRSGFVDRYIASMHVHRTVFLCRTCINDDRNAVGIQVSHQNLLLQLDWSWKIGLADRWNEQIASKAFVRANPHSKEQLSPIMEFKGPTGLICYMQTSDIANT